MAYFNGYPASYQPVYQQPQNNGIIWVSGEAGAKAYMVAPNNTVQLWDSESQTIYLKSADASGLPSMRVLDYTIRDMAQNTAFPPVSAKVDNNASYATKEEIKAVSDELMALRKRIEKMEVTE